MLSGNLPGTHRSCDSHHGKKSYELIFHVLLKTLSFSLLWSVGIPNFVEGNSFLFYPQGFLKISNEIVNDFELVLVRNERHILCWVDDLRWYRSSEGLLCGNLSPYQCSANSLQISTFLPKKVGISNCSKLGS